MTTRCVSRSLYLSRSLSLSLSPSPSLSLYFKVVWNRRWLSCITGALAGLAFVVDETNTPSMVVGQHCRQLAEFERRWAEDGSKGEAVDAPRIAAAVQLCITQGMSRTVLYNARTNHTDASTGSAWDGTNEMQIWPVELLAFENLKDV